MSKKTTEWFIEKATKIHKGFYDYTISIYTGSNNKIIINCPNHGNFSMTASTHISGQGCRKCWIERCSQPINGNKNTKCRLTTEQFIEKANLKYDNFYDYSKSIYTLSKNKINIICPIHGLFSQLAMSHLRGHGCKKCGDKTPKKKLKNKKKKSVEELFENFSKKANTKYNFKYDYSKVNYLNTKNSKIEIICPIHGSFWQTPFGHLQSNGCKQCSKVNFSKLRFSNTEKFIKNSIKIHGDLYDYSLVDYTTSKTKVKIICKEHGVFEQEPRSHLQNQGCPECNRYVGFDKTRWIEYNKGKEGIFYTIRCFNEEESFYKIGITGNTVLKRYKHIKAMPYNYEIINEIKSFDLEYIWNLEKDEKRRLKDYKYKPLNKFPGSSKECFTKY